MKIAISYLNSTVPSVNIFSTFAEMFVSKCWTVGVPFTYCTSAPTIAHSLNCVFLVFSFSIIPITIRSLRNDSVPHSLKRKKEKKKKEKNDAL